MVLFLDPCFRTAGDMVRGIPITLSEWAEYVRKRVG